MGFAERGRMFWRGVVGPVALLLCAYLAYESGPVVAARDGDGRSGVWTADAVVCTHHGCAQAGDFLSADRTDHRAGVRLAGIGFVPAGGARAAVDSGGDEVYPPGWSGWWHYPVGAALVGVVVALWLWTFPVRVLLRRRAR
ncbi:hypothetical protein [Streptomyces sp. MMG1121]|uniref:hypothetical protein n=1 Tax=Streptomyces sp. MMG1121 TaxID=1415544 RepID=UPI0006AF8EE7|nr:hypothetical protein [Streptomyces sp. MMG1121]KOV63436.1 hypothetical protein ADK64_20095 [Streptomyces sp. MMG1121]